MIFPALRGKKLKPTWIFETSRESEIIWKLLISPNGILAGEERDTEAKTGSLFAVDVASGKTLWRHVTLDEPWWFGSEKATNDTLFIQTFRKPDLPEAKGIIALDIRTGKIRWHEPEMSFLFVEKDRVFAMRQGYSHRNYFALDAGTGAILEDYEEDASAIAEARNHSSEIDPLSHFADPLNAAAPERKQLFDALKDGMGLTDLRGPVEFLEFGKYRIFCFHARALGADAQLQNMLSNQMIIIAKDSGRLLFRETLHSKTPLPLPDNFFITHGTLIYVKEKRTLVGIALP